MNVKSRYTNISNDESIEAVREKLNTQTDKSIAKTVIIKFLFLLLALKHFIFNSINYLEIKGCAMGTICAPSYGNIMNQFESTHIRTSERKQ